MTFGFSFIWYDDVWWNLSIEIVFISSYQFYLFNTPYAYTRVYYPQPWVFLVVIGLYDPYIHDCGDVWLVMTDLCHIPWIYFIITLGYHYMGVLFFLWDANICMIVGCTDKLLVLFVPPKIYTSGAILGHIPFLLRRSIWGSGDKWLVLIAYFMWASFVILGHIHHFDEMNSFMPCIYDSLFYIGD